MSDNKEANVGEGLEPDTQEEEMTKGEVATDGATEEAVGETAVASTDDDVSKPKKKKKLGFKILIVVAIVIVVLGGGVGGFYLGFHNQPWFCNFICHTPMDPYVASYEDGTSVNPAQATSTAQLSVIIHKESDQSIDCLTCHEPNMSEQISEGMKWVSGNYEIPLEMKVVYGEPKEGSDAKNGQTFCLREGCHEGISTIDDLKKSMASQSRNPHDSHNGKQDCNTCHQTHEQSVMTCTQCHADAQVPEGWLTYKEQQEQKKQLPAS